MQTRLSIRWFLSLHFALVLVAQSVIILALAWQILLPRMRSDLQLHYQALARAVAGEVTAHMLGGQSQLAILADYIETESLLPDNRWVSMLDAQCGNGELFEAIYLADYQNETISTIGLARPRRPKREDLVGLDLSNRDFLRTAKSLKRPLWSETFLSTASGSMAVSVTIPLSHRAIVGEITVDQLSALVRRLPVESELFTMILDGRGMVIADSGGLRVGQLFNSDQMPATLDPPSSDVASTAFELAGRPMLGSIVTVEPLGWKVLVAQALTSAYQPIWSTFSTILIGMSLAIALALALAWFQATSLTHPFRALTKQARLIARGKYNLESPKAKTREVIQLWETMQEMAHTISLREQQILDNENRLKITLDSLGDAVMTTDMNGIVTGMNPSAEKLTGWHFEEAQGKDLSQVFHIVIGDESKEAPDPVEKVSEKIEPDGLSNDTVLMSRKGDAFRVAYSRAPIRQADGAIVGVVIVFRDVTERYAQERKIRENEQRLQNITANVPGAVYQFTSTGNHEFSMPFVSERAAEIFSIKANASTFYEKFRSRIPMDELAHFDASVRDAVDKVAPWQYEGRFIQPCGETIWFSGNAIPRRQGDRIVYNGLLMDITHRRQLEEDLRRTQFCFEKATIGIFWIGGEGEILNANEQACRSLGYSRAELCGLKVFDIDPAFNREIWPSHIDKLRMLKSRTIETLHKHRDGRVFPVQILINLINFENQEFHVAFVEDISDRKRSAEENRRLEVALLQAQKMEAIGTLAGGVAHDFNNILSAVMGYSELSLKQVEKESSLHDNLAQIIAAALRARDLVQQILAFSRQENRALMPLQIGPLIKEALRLIRASLPSTIEIRKRIDGGLDNVLADPSQIHQIVMNLCTNAAHAMEENGGVLSVTLSQVALGSADIVSHPGLRQGNYIKLSIQDTGIGIPLEVKDKIFDPYFTTKMKGKGTGLGLSVVHGIVHKYGGSVYVYSEPGSGTTFSVYFPAIEKVKLPHTSNETVPPTGNEHILFVDDEPVLIEVGKMLLEMLGYRVTACENGLEALEVFHQSPSEIDLVISDVTMPKITGDNLAIELLKVRKDLPIILCTGFSNRISEEKISAIGVKAIVMKPLIQNDLALLVRRVLDEAKRANSRMPF